MAKGEEKEGDNGVEGFQLPFNGSLTGMNGVSNEKELAEKCPGEFSMVQNEWVKYAQQLMFGLSAPLYKKWKSSDMSIQHRQYELFHGIFNSHSLDTNEKARILAWMTSEMYSEVPTA